MRPAVPVGATLLALRSPQKPLQPVQVGGALREEEVVGVACLPALLHDWQDAGRALTVLAPQGAADVIGVRGKALGGGHDPIRVSRDALGAGSLGRGRHWIPGGYFRGSVLITVPSRGYFCRPAAIEVGRLECAGGYRNPGWHLGLVLGEAGMAQTGLP